MAADHAADSKLHHRHHRKEPHLSISRPIYTERDFQKHYKHIEENETNLEKVKRKINEVEVTPTSIWHFILRLIPILKWLPSYNIRNDIIGDIISGITVGIMRIPQAMAYAILVTLPAIYGLYVAFFAVLVYAVLGTSRHIAIGTWAIVSIMAADAIDSIVSQEENGKPTVAPMITDGNEDDDTALRVQVAISLCLLTGIIQLAMGILRLGIVTIYLSEPLVRGFTTGACFHVFTSQFPKLIGISVERYTGPFAQVYTYIEVFSKLSSANSCAIVVSILSLILLVLIAELNDRQAAKGWFRPTGTKGKKLPVPSELLVVIIATAASHLGNFEAKYDLPVVGDIPTGLPQPIVPPTKYFVSLLGSAFAISIVGFAISFAMAQLFAKKHNYEVDANQEFIAYGTTHLFCSFFQCFPHATSMSRTAVQEGAGGRTQLAGIFSSIIVLVILLWLGPLFSQLPECVLACIINVALRGMFRQIMDLRTLWKVSIVDFLLWFVTFTLVMLLGVDIGLLGGVIFSLITVVVRSQSPYCTLMGRIPDTEIYRDISCVQGVEELGGIKIFQCSASLSFINASHFRDSLYKIVGVNPKLTKAKRDESQTQLNGKANEYTPLMDSDAKKYTISTGDHQTQGDGLHTIIIECSMFHYVDVVGVKTLQEIVTDYDAVGVRVIFAKCNATVRKALLSTTTINKSQEIDLDRMYVSLHDSVLSSLRGPGSLLGSSVEQSASEVTDDVTLPNEDIVPSVHYRSDSDKEPTNKDYEKTGMANLAFVNSNTTHEANIDNEDTFI